MIIDKGQDQLRIDKFLVNRIEGATRNKVQKAINAGMVLVNDKEIKSNYKIKPLDAIIVYSDMSPEETDVVPEKMDLNIVYEDADLMIINKPAGMVVHPGSGNYSGTLLNGVAYYLQQKIQPYQKNCCQDLDWFTVLIKIQVVLLVLAKTDKAMRQLAKQFFDHTVKRQYVALVWGDVQEDTGTIRSPCGP